MTLTELSLFQFRLPLLIPFSLGKETITERTGFVLEVRDEEGNSGFGEIAPLPGWHDEALKQCEEESKKLIWSMRKAEIPSNLEELSGGFGKWLSEHHLSPSVRYGFESALLTLLADRFDTTVAELISDTELTDADVNALLNGTADEITQKLDFLLLSGYRTFKLKVGRKSLQEEINLVKSVSRQLTGNKLRLDANRGWSLEQATEFLNGIADVPYEYIEEPLANSNDISALVKRVPNVRIARDESLIGTMPEQLETTEGVTAIILKPSLFGVENTMRFARRGRSLGILPVISSPFETGIGLTMSANLATAINPEPVAAGLESYNWLATDILTERIEIENARINLQKCELSPERIDYTKLERIE